MRLRLTKEEAQMLMDVHGIRDCLINKEEVELMRQHNPDLLAVYLKLAKIADAKEPRFAPESERGSS